MNTAEQAAIDVDQAAPVGTAAPSLPGAPVSEPKVHTWVPKVKQGKDYTRQKDYLAIVDPDKLHRFVHLRPITGYVYPVMGSQQPKPIYGLYGGATIVIEIDYKAQVVRAGLSLVHMGGVEKTPGVNADGKEVTITKIIKPDNYCRTIGRYEAVERILDREAIQLRTDQLKHTYLELPVDFFQASIEENVVEAQNEVNMVTRSYGLFAKLDIKSLIDNLSLQNVSNETIQCVIIDAFAVHFKQLKNYF